MIVQESPNHRPEIRALLRDRQVSPAQERLFHCQELGPQPFLDRPSSHDEAATPVLLGADVREAQEVERVGLAPLTLPPVLVGEPTELQQPCLVGVQAQAKLLHPALEIGQELFGFVLVLEPHDKVVGIADDDHIAVSPTLSPLVHPTDLDEATLKAIYQRWPELQETAELAKQFAGLFKEHDANSLEAWVQLAEGPSILVEVRRFAVGLRQDWEAVLAAVRGPWSQGQVEGQINRLKLIKRGMYGRANFDLLRQRVLHAEQASKRSA